jgi:hypothetical protein
MVLLFFLQEDIFLEKTILKNHVSLWNITCKFCSSNVSSVASSCGTARGTATLSLQIKLRQKRQSLEIYRSRESDQSSTNSQTKTSFLAFDDHSSDEETVPSRLQPTAWHIERYGQNADHSTQGCGPIIWAARYPSKGFAAHIHPWLHPAWGAWKGNIWSRQQGLKLAIKLPQFSGLFVSLLQDPTRWCNMQIMVVWNWAFPYLSLWKRHRRCLSLSPCDC